MPPSAAERLSKLERDLETTLASHTVLSDECKLLRHNLAAITTDRDTAYSELVTMRRELDAVKLLYKREEAKTATLITIAYALTGSPCAVCGFSGAPAPWKADKP